jgi:hypothetical protein
MLGIGNVKIISSMPALGDFTVHLERQTRKQMIQNWSLLNWLSFVGTQKRDCLSLFIKEVIYELVS